MDAQDDTAPRSTAHEEAERTRAVLLNGVRQAKLAHAISCGVAGREMPESVQADPLAPVAYALGMAFMATGSGPDGLLLMEAMTRYLGHGPLCIRGVYVDDLWPRPEPLRRRCR